MIFLKLSRFFLFISVFCVLVVLTRTFFPFIGGKYFFFRVSVELSLVFLILWWAFAAPAGHLARRLREVSNTPLFIAVSAFVFAFLLASLFSYNPHAAFWSNFERGEGAFQMLHYYLFFVLLSVLFDKREDWKKMFKVSLVAAILLILYGIGGNFQIKGIPFLRFLGPYSGGSGAGPGGFWETLTQGRFQGTLGNPAYVAPYLMFAIFYVLYLWKGFERKSAPHGKSGDRNIFSWLTPALLAAVFLFFFVLSQTRGAFVGLLASVVAFLVVLFVLKPRWRLKLASLFAVLVVLGAVGYVFRATSFVKKLPGSRLLEISLTDQTAKTRFWTWGSAWQGFKERPLLGWGPENFSSVFDKHFNPNHYVPGRGSETWFDRAHSVIFDYLAETGIIGFVAYSSMFAVFFWAWLRGLVRRVKGHQVFHDATDFGYALLFALPIAYLVQGLALFDVLPVYLNLFIFIAFAQFILYRHHAATEAHPTHTS